MLEYTAIETLVRQDFEQFDFADQPMEKYCKYNKNKHISMSVNLVRQAFGWKNHFNAAELNDFIHGLNHLYFNGVAAGQSFEWYKRKGTK